MHTTQILQRILVIDVELIGSISEVPYVCWVVNWKAMYIVYY